ncbi:MAG TPA: transcription-repair coupling factor [Spirochaetaceae bacterium]|nr:transcription-repair coupling factor [Spirochaetaceae bacterium]
MNEIQQDAYPHNTKNRIKYNSADKDILDTGILSGLEIESGKHLLVKTSVGFLQNLMILDYRDRTDEGNIYVIYASREECESNAAAIKERYENTIAICNDCGNREAFDSSFVQAAKDIQHGKRKNIILTTYKTVCNVIPIFSDDAGSAMTIRKGEKLNIRKLSSFLTESGYCEVPFLQNGGDFSLFGEVVCAFPVFSANPIRIYLDFDEIEKIAYYDLQTDENIAETEEYSFAKIDTLHSNNAAFASIFAENDSFVFVGMEKLLTLKAQMKGIIDSDNFEKWFENNDNSVKCEFYEMSDDTGAKPIDGVREAEPFVSFKVFCEKLNSLLKFDYKVRILTNSIIQMERIKALLNIKDNDNLRFEESEINKGFYLEKYKIAFFSANDIFNKKERANVFSSLQTQPIMDFMSLRPGDFVVHSQNGIGRFIGFDKIEMLGRERDYIKIEYSDKEFFYVPLERANEVEKYIGSEKIKLDKLHSNSWSKKKKKAMENAMLFADNLLKINARRKMSNGFCHMKDTQWQLIFEEGFENEETPDQLQAIEDVKRDMERPIPMDRIICGDVGFGKTEVAFRACFKAIMSGRQVCFISPTTILTSQHFNNFKKRCADFPIRIEELSRIKKKSEATKIIERLGNGTADIVFATHRALHKDVKFKNLGLLVVDEEQRFGVKDKETIRDMKANVDTLTLTATPIPRTLYMSLLKLRDVSLLSTPPKQRVAIETVIRRYDEDVETQAIEYELKRGGQVFYLHNDTSDIRAVRNRISNTFPNAKADFIHGKMRSIEIENSIYNFANGWTDILVSTTIIENGIDVPNANTLIVDDATIYGTSQLYQIKGRVGRSSRKAIAYLFYPQKKNVNPTAIARLKVISENKSLGSGFNIAMNDLALRGAGNILSKEQSGHIAEVGFETYMHLLDLCIKSLESGKDADGINVDEEFNVYINIPYSAYVPDTYIGETAVKFILYKQLANAKSEGEIAGILSRIENRYGKLPAPLVELYRINLIKIICKEKRISEISESDDKNVLSLRYAKVKDMKISAVLELVKRKSGKIMLNNSRPNEVLLDCRNENDKIGCLIETLRML